MRTLWSLLITAVIAGITSCAGESEQTIAPAARGARGESCQARNDCAAGLACINRTCSKNDFGIKVNSKHCDLVDCESDKDCCGDKPREAPAKCANRTSVCFTPTLSNCEVIECESNSACGDGECVPGRCQFTSTVSCTEDDDCVDQCVGNSCSLSLNYCLDDSYCYQDNPCINRYCDCSNPEYDPTDPICTDPDCDNVCTLSCENERCVPDTSCETDADCAGLVNDICEDGRCVECTDDDDCDEDANETCSRGSCHKPCTENEECPLFHACDDGECVERGCGTDTECILAASRTQDIEDPRLAKCLPVAEGSDINICKVPCENDSECSRFEVCNEGYCVFIGCKNHEECRAYFGLEREETSEDKPYITKALCR